MREKGQSTLPLRVRGDVVNLKGTRRGERNTLSGGHGSNTIHLKRRKGEKDRIKEERRKGEIKRRGEEEVNKGGGEMGEVF